MKRSDGNHFHARLLDKVYPGAGAGAAPRKVPGVTDTAGGLTRDIGEIALPAAADQHRLPG